MLEGVGFTAAMYTRAHVVGWCFYLFTCLPILLVGIFLGVFWGFALDVFLIWFFIFDFLLLWCFWCIWFFDFLMVFWCFLDFSTIFFLEFWTSFTHQKGYNLLQFSCNLFFLEYTGWRWWWVTRKRHGVKFTACVWYLTGYAKSIKKYKTWRLVFSGRPCLQVAI